MTKRANVKTKKDALINQGIGTFVPTPNRALSRLCEEEQLTDRETSSCDMWTCA